MGYYNLSLETEDEAVMKGARHQLSSKMDRIIRPAFARHPMGAPLVPYAPTTPVDCARGGELSFAGRL